MEAKIKVRGLYSNLKEEEFKVLLKKIGEPRTVSFSIDRGDTNDIISILETLKNEDLSENFFESYFGRKKSEINRLLLIIKEDDIFYSYINVSRSVRESVNISIKFSQIMEFSIALDMPIEIEDSFLDNEESSWAGFEELESSGKFENLLDFRSDDETNADQLHELYINEDYRELGDFRDFHGEIYFNLLLSKLKEDGRIKE